MNGQNQSAEMFLFIFIDLEMTVMQKMAVEPGIRFLDINGFASLHFIQVYFIYSISFFFVK